MAFMIDFKSMFKKDFYYKQLKHNVLQMWF